MADEVQDQLATATHKPTVMATRILRHKDGRKMAFAFVAIRPEGVGSLYLVNSVG